MKETFNYISNNYTYLENILDDMEDDFSDTFE
jgi:hypothetical protein